MASTTTENKMLLGHDCSQCIHTNVCFMKFKVKDAIELYKNVHLTVCCDEYLPAEKAVQPRKVVRRNVVRKAKTNGD